MEPNKDIIFESKISKISFILKSLPSIILRIGYFFFSVHWIYRFFQIEVSYLFLLMGLFFILSSLYFLLYPLLINKSPYILTEDIFYYVGPFWRYNSIKNLQIKDFEMKKSIVDKISKTASFELTFSSDDSEDKNFIELYGIKNYHTLNLQLQKFIQGNKHEQKIIDGDKKGDKMLIKDTGLLNFLRDHYKKIFFTIIILVIIIVGYVLIKNISQTEEVTGYVTQLTEDIPQTEDVLPVLERAFNCNDDNCYYEFARNTHNPDMCINVKGIFLRCDCYYFIAKDMNNMGICDMIPYPAPEGCVKDRDYCYTKFASDNKDLAICEKVQGKSKKELCLAQLAVDLNNSKICEQIDSINTRDGCYFLIAINSFNGSICDYMVGEQKDYCHSEVGTTVGTAPDKSPISNYSLK